MKKVGILYDNISRNTGDLAIGLSVKKILKNLNCSYDELIPGFSDTSNYEKIIVGGGLLLRKKGDFFYDKFRPKGNHILNCMGVYDFPPDLDYLDKYAYISVRSTYDKQQLSYLKKEVHVVPCTTLLLDDVEIGFKINGPSIGIHCFNNGNFFEILELITKYSKDFNIYLLPITHYNYDFEFQDKIFQLAKKLGCKNVFKLPILGPLEIFTVIGKFNYFMSYSLHGALFAYAHNVPFMLWNNPSDQKMSAFMSDHRLEDLFNIKNMDAQLHKILNSRRDYSSLFTNDKQKISDHIERIKDLL